MFCLCVELLYKGKAKITLNHDIPHESTPTRPCKKYTGLGMIRHNSYIMVDVLCVIMSTLHRDYIYDGNVGMLLKSHTMNLNYGEQLWYGKKILWNEITKVQRLHF